MQTGQNSIAPENSLPQLGRVRLSSVFMGLIALQPQFEPKAAHGPQSGVKAARGVRWRIKVPFHKQLRV